MLVKGDIISMNLDGTSNQFRVLKINNTVAECVSMFNVSSSVKCATNKIYADGSLDIYLNSTWYNTLSSIAKTAIIDKTFTQDSWYLSIDGNPDYCGIYNDNGTITNYQISLDTSSFGSSITRHIYALSVQDIIDYLGTAPEMTYETTTLTYNNIWSLFWNDTQSHPDLYLWLRSAIAASSARVSYVRGNTGHINGISAYSSAGARAAFQIDLTKIDWSIVS